MMGNFPLIALLYTTAFTSHTLSVSELLYKNSHLSNRCFTSMVFRGNPAAVCLLEGWLEDSILQSIAQENNLSETAFLVQEKEKYRIRWFTPVAEVDLCGHATLAAAFVIFSLKPLRSQIEFISNSRRPDVTKNQNLIALDFPSSMPSPCVAPKPLLDGLIVEPLEVLASNDYLVVFSSEEDVVNLAPDMRQFQQLGLRGVIVTAQGNNADFVSRFFAPQYGIDEDRVTGSAHCSLTPYWANRLNKQELYMPNR